MKIERSKDWWMKRARSEFGDATTGVQTARCAHENFGARVDVTRLSKEPDGQITGYTADVQVRCQDCGVAFRFIGVPHGFSPFAPRVSADATELRAPLEPAIIPELLGRPEISGAAMSDFGDFITTGDHARGCAGREYACTCGYDEAKDAEILRLRAELAALREPAGDLVEVAARIIADRDPNCCWMWEGPKGGRRRDRYLGVARAVLDAVLPRVRAEGSGVVAEIAAERRRQVEIEGWTPQHDRQHAHGEMAAAALCYVQSALGEIGSPKSPLRGVPGFWPWADDWWKPKNPRRDLIRAGALIVAEIERLDRLPPPSDAAP